MGPVGRSTRSGCVPITECNIPEKLFMIKYSLMPITLLAAGVQKNSRLVLLSVGRSELPVSICSGCPFSYVLREENENIENAEKIPALSSVSFIIKLFGWSRRVTPCVTSFMCFPRAIVEVNVAKNRKSAPANIIDDGVLLSYIIRTATLSPAIIYREGEKVAKKR